MANNNVLVEIKDLSKLYPVGAGIFRQSTMFVHAVSNFNLDINEITPGVGADYPGD